MIILPDDLYLFDNSSLKNWRERGPRYWYYNHYRYWVPEPQHNNPTITASQNGLAWHAMMDTYWADPLAGWEPAWATYEQYWRANGLAGGFPIDDLDPEFERSLQPYAPATMEANIIAYDELRRPLLKNIELIRTERPFIIQLSPTNDKLFYMGRMDKVFHYDKQLIAADHKSTSTYYVRPIGRPHLRPWWKEGWRVNTQPRGYLYALKQEFHLTRTSIWIDGTLFHPDATDFCLEPIECQVASLDSWLWMTHNTIAEILRHIETVEELRAKGTAPDLPYLPAFPCAGCSGACAYSGLCQQRDNPESWIEGEEIPDGFVRKVWAPFNAKEVALALEAKE